MILEFLVYSYTNNSFPPDQFLIQQEIDILKFSSTGALKDNSLNVLKFLAGNYFLYHCLVKEIFYTPQDLSEKISPKAIQVFKDLGGYLYYAYTEKHLSLFEKVENNMKEIKIQDRDIIATEIEPPVCKLIFVTFR